MQVLNSQINKSQKCVCVGVRKLQNISPPNQLSLYMQIEFRPSNQQKWCVYKSEYVGVDISFWSEDF